MAQYVALRGRTNKKNCMIQGGSINLASGIVHTREQRAIYPLRERVSWARESVMGMVLFVVLFGVFLFLFNLDYAMLAKRVQAFMDPYGFVRTEKIPRTWLERYNIVISTDADTEVDQDGDGLSLYKEYIYLTDPINPDTDGDGVPDGEEVAKGQNPRGLGILDVDHDGMSDIWEREHGLDPLRNDRDEDRDEDGLTNYKEYLHKLDPLNPDTDNDTFSDGTEVHNGYDPSAPGDAKPETTIVINKINVTAPMVWSQSVFEEQLQADLSKGAIHYPKTAAPGQPGNMFIAAHSSNYAWVEGNFNYVFSKLNNVKPGDTIVVTTTQANGATIKYLYKAVEQRVVQPDDPWIFLKTEKPTATFSTCWPLGTRQKRLIVKAELVQVQ